MIRPGVEVRYRRRARGRWHSGVITGLTDKGGAVWIRDGNGASRCFRLDQVELVGHDPNGATTWRTAADAQRRPQQLTL